MNIIPRVAFPILQVRADDTPMSDSRIRSAGNLIDTEGNPISEPDKNPDKIALESNPNLAFEHYGEYWRKVHGPRVAFDGGEDYMCSGVTDYYQIQRVTAGPSGAFPPPYKPILDENGQLYDVMHDKVPKYKRPRFDGLVYWTAPTIEKLKPVGYSQHCIQKISDEGAVFTRGDAASMKSEYVIKPWMKEALLPVCTVKIHYRKDGEQEEFQRNLLFNHSEKIISGPMADKYIRRFAYLFNISRTEKDPFYSVEGAKVDAISVTYFDNMGDCEAYYSSDEYKSIQRIEDEMVNTDLSEWWTGIVYPIINTPDQGKTDKQSNVKEL